MENQKLKFHHFSHEHPLELTNYSPSKQNKFCAGCKLMIQSGKDYYSCPTCPFLLHQVCYSMPRKMRHPAHPSHYLNLHPSPPSSTKGALNCRACQTHVMGFYYDCADCGFYYHSLCSGLPFSIKTSSHPHALKLSFSPPFDLSCDLCNESGYDQWLYRCHICEFDSHISCAIYNMQPGLEPTQNPIPPPPANGFTRQSSYSSGAFFGINEAENYNSEGNELLHLVRQIVFKGNIKSIGDKKVSSAAVTGWDKRLISPKQEFNFTTSKLGNGGSHQTDADMAITSLNSKDTATSVSEDITLTPSYQFSDAYFSIDLAKSTSNGQKIQANREGPNQGTLSYTDSTIPPKKVLSSAKPAKQPNYVNVSGTNYSIKIGPENKLNEAFLTRNDTLTRKESGPKEMKRKASDTMGSSDTGNQSPKSDMDSNSPSCWLSCCNTGYERVSPTILPTWSPALGMPSWNLAVWNMIVGRVTSYTFKDIIVTSQTHNTGMILRSGHPKPCTRAPPLVAEYVQPT
ncbi:hypothetical protein ACFX13_014432 [Malus domestica]